MASYSRKSTRNKALWGYLLLIAVLLSSSWFVYHEINLLVSIKAVEADMRLKRQEMSSALSALYRAETVGQSLVWGQFSDYPVYRRVTNDAVTCVDSLRRITSDSVQLSRIDSIIGLLNRNRCGQGAKPENRGYDETARFVDPYSESSAKIGSTERFADRETPP